MNPRSTAPRRALALAALAAALSTLGCTKENSVVVTGAGKYVSAEAIDADPLALLPAGAVVVAAVDTRAMYGAPSVGALAAMATARVPIGAESGFVPQRDLTRATAGVYSFAGADAVAVLEGTFDLASIGAAAARGATAPNGQRLVASRYAGNTVYTAGQLAMSVLTPHTALVGNETGVRRAMDRIRDDRLGRALPAWMLDALSQPKASLVLLADLASQPQVAAFSRSMPFLQGATTANLLGNFHAPGLNVVGTLGYADPGAASQAAGALQQLGQMAGLLNVFSALGVGTPLRELRTQVVGTDVQLAAVVDGGALAALVQKSAGSLGAM